MNKKQLYIVIGTDDFHLIREYLKNLSDLTDMNYIIRGVRPNTSVPLVSDMVYEFACLLEDSCFEYHIEIIGSLTNSIIHDLRSVFRPYMNENGNDIVFGKINFHTPEKMENEDFLFLVTYNIKSPLSMVEARAMLKNLITSARCKSIFQKDF